MDTTAKILPPQISRGAQKGAGSLGFLLVAIPIIMLGLGGIELAWWASLRQNLSAALLAAARTGSTNQSDPELIAQAFEDGLHIIWPRSATRARILAEHRQAVGFPWQITINSPSRAAFADHADATLGGPRAYANQPLINNLYQQLQQRRNIARGWVQGEGPISQENIFQANTLSLDLLWPQKPLLPLVGTVLKALAPLAQDPEQARIFSAGYLPFRRNISLTMQSHPALWQPLEDGRVIYGAQQTTALCLP